MKPCKLEVLKLIAILFAIDFVLNMVFLFDDLRGISLFFFISSMIAMLGICFQFPRKTRCCAYKARYANLFLVLFSISFSLMIFEGVIKYADELESSAITPLKDKVVMPAKLQRASTTVKGSERSYYWMGKLHVHKYEGFRRTSAFPKKDESTFRVMVIGDSLTYGYGISEEDTYSMLIQNALSKERQTEVINLGVSGFQSEDVFEILQKYLPIIQPDLILYGVCLNDFLPSGIGQYSHSTAYEIPFPFKNIFIYRTRTGKFLTEKYNKLLINMGLRVDFFGDILKDFRNYRTRFAHDVKAMNQFAQSEGYPPIIGMVLSQFPCSECPGLKIAKFAEQYMEEGGMTVLKADYIETYADSDLQLYVNQWEGHPNEKANEIFAEKFLDAIVASPQLQNFDL